MKRLFVIGLCTFLVGLWLNAGAQSPTVTSKDLFKTTLTDDNTREVIMRLVEFPPGSALIRHIHPGEELAFVLEGTLETAAEGREPRRVSKGDTFHNAPGVIHIARNVGDTTVRLLATFIVEKGKPVFQPVK